MIDGKVKPKSPSQPAQPKSNFLFPANSALMRGMSLDMGYSILIGMTGAKRVKPES